jgi:hypothetical protein
MPAGKAVETVTLVAATVSKSTLLQARSSQTWTRAVATPAGNAQDSFGCRVFTNEPEIGAIGRGGGKMHDPWFATSGGEHATSHVPDKQESAPLHCPPQQGCESAPHATHVPLSHVPPELQTSFMQQALPTAPQLWHMPITQIVDVSQVSLGGQHGMFAIPHPGLVPPKPPGSVPPKPPPKPPFPEPPLGGPASIPTMGPPPTLVKPPVLGEPLSPLPSLPPAPPPPPTVLPASPVLRSSPIEFTSLVSAQEPLGVHTWPPAQSRGDTHSFRHCPSAAQKSPSGQTELYAQLAS